MMDICIEDFVRLYLRKRAQAAAILSVELSINGIEFIPRTPTVELRSGIFELAEMCMEQVTFEITREGSVSVTTYSFKIDGAEIIQREYKLAESEDAENG